MLRKRSVLKVGCGWMADRLVRAMVEAAPENDYYL
jgi:hypothetical protein